ncbi:MAG: glutamine amidotransferase [Gemmatimonadota bacterium]|nr:glutamine amidotransferase [Gemmatimonadota bacterium]
MSATRKKILFMGDDDLKGAAAYLGAMLTHAGFGFDYRPSAQRTQIDNRDESIGLFILSDYPAANLDYLNQQALAERVGEGAGLLMIGGWESFHGQAGQYHTGPVADILPVVCRRQDDRINYCHGAFPALEKEHPCLAGLPWETPPVVCGFNQVTAKQEAETVLSLRLLEIEGNKLGFAGKQEPLLVFGSHGEGKTAALTTDMAPHWVGGWVDWGEPRLSARAPGGNEVEVGCLYAQFIRQLVGYLLEG